MSSKNKSKYHNELMGTPVPTDGVRTKANEKRVWDSGEDAMINIDAVTKSSMCQGIVSSAENEKSTYFERTDLDTHANTVVLGRNRCVVNYSDKTVEVHLFRPDCKSLQLPTVDASIQYDDSYSGDTYMVVYKEKLHMLAIKHNLIRHFLMREACLIVDDLPKGQSINPTEHYPSMHLPDELLYMPLRSYGIFSYFQSKKPLVSVLNDYNNRLLFLTTVNINSHNEIYS